VPYDTVRYGAVGCYTMLWYGTALGTDWGIKAGSGPPPAPSFEECSSKCITVLVSLSLLHILHHIFF
jgi:hypothetical protein